MDGVLLVLGALYGTMAAGAGLTAIVHRRIITSEWRHAADRLFLELSYGLFSGVAMSGTLEGFDARIELDRRNAQQDWVFTTRYTLSGEPLSRKMSLAGSNNPIGLKGPRVLVGDAAFDSLVRVAGRRDAILALLDRSTRSRLADFVSNDMNRFDAGVLVSERAGRDGVAETIVDHMNDLKSLAVRLSLAPEDIPKRLARNAREEPHRTIRRANLDTLIARYRDTEACAEAITFGLHCGAPEMRISAARAIGKAGAPVLQDAALDPRTRFDERREALEALADVVEAEDLVAVLNRLIHDDDPALALPALAVARARRIHAVLDAVRDRAGSAPPSHQPSLVDTLSELGDETDTDTLLTFVCSGQAGSTLPAVRALGQVGALHAVEALRALSNKLLESPELKRTARAAIKSIQERAGKGAVPGRLSVLAADEDGGALSVAEDEGAVAIVEEE